MRCGVANTSLVGTFLRCTSSAWVVGEPGMGVSRCTLEAGVGFGSYAR